MTASRTRIAIVLSLFACSLALALGPGCEVFTRETCNAADLVGLPESNTARPVCKECLERAATCDTVGRCNDVSGCTQSVREAHQCVLDAGRLAFREESRCVASLAEAPKATYAKMRESCGKECALPVCKVDQATVRFGAPECDRCITGACCDEINRCYANRTCKLILECIVKCPDPLNPTAFPDFAPDQGPCAAGDGGPPASSGCVTSCLTAFAAHEQRVEGADPKDSAQCIAYSIRKCAIDTQCSGSCDGGLAAP
ncbi:MAG: hypothetical protein JST00_27190 [Deltaproteobacteria bacterium]|nr:hypothetical protein [Deltaproteobacteria bacterium]